VVDAVEHLDDDALDPQVITPDPLDELGVVATFHPDPGGACHPGARVAHRDRAAGGPPRRGRPGARSRRDESHRLAIDPEAGAERERAGASLAVLEHDHVLAAALLDPHHSTDPAAGHVLDDQTAIRGHVGGLRLAVAV